MIVEAIDLLCKGIHLTRDQSANVIHQIMSGEATPAQIGAYLIAQKLAGETVDEIVGAAQTMRSLATKVDAPIGVVDTCGTGGDHFGTFNISTCAAFVAAGAGVQIAKHGSRSVSSSSGSADVLQSLGVNLDITADQAGECIRELGIGFLFAPSLHAAMKHAIGPRREIAQRSIFNLLGPLTNPANAQRQVMGVFDATLVQPLALVLGELGAQKIWVVRGEDGLDEISLMAPTQVAQWHKGLLTEFTFDPRDYGYSWVDVQELKAGTPAQSAEMILGVLNGQIHGAPRQIVELNAAAAIFVSSDDNDFAHALQCAKQSLDSGAAMAKLNALISKTGSF